MVLAETEEQKMALLDNLLKEKFPEQMRDIYISYVHKTAERTGGHCIAARAL